MPAAGPGEGPGTSGGNTQRNHLSQTSKDTMKEFLVMNIMSSDLPTPLHSQGQRSTDWSRSDAPIIQE